MIGIDVKGLSQEVWDKMDKKNKKKNLKTLWSVCSESKLNGNEYDENTNLMFCHISG